MLREIHAAVTGLHAAGIFDTVTMRTFDRLCLPLPELYLHALRRLREHARVIFRVRGRHPGAAALEGR
jgi:hypothetical protein